MQEGETKPIPAHRVADFECPVYALKDICNNVLKVKFLDASIVTYTELHAWFV